MFPRFDFPKELLMDAEIERRLRDRLCGIHDFLVGVPPERKFMGMVRRLTHEEIVEGQMLPSWYCGYAYEEWDRGRRIFAVIPLNYLMRFRSWCRHKWNGFRAKPSWFDREINRQSRLSYNDGFSRGLEDGWRDEKVAYEKGFRKGVLAGQKQALDEVEAILDKRLGEKTPSELIDGLCGMHDCLAGVPSEKKSVEAD